VNPVDEALQDPDRGIQTLAGYVFQTSNAVLNS
jgi:hypothetical protein